LLLYKNKGEISRGESPTDRHTAHGAEEEILGGLPCLLLSLLFILASVRSLRFTPVAVKDITSSFLELHSKVRLNCILLVLTFWWIVALVNERDLSLTE